MASAIATLDVATTGARHVKSRRIQRGVTTLMYAAQQGEVDKARKIIRGQQPESVRKRDRTGKTPLHYCTTSSSIRAAQVADFLVMAAPDLVDKHDEEGFTPLHLAVIAGNMPLVTFLLANKADVAAVDNERHTVVHWATVCGESGALSAVIAAGAPVSTPDVHGGYPLHYAAQMCGGDKDGCLGLQVLQILLGHAATSVSVRDGDGRQPLLWAASAGSSRAVLALIRAGAQLDSTDKDGLNALHCAASRGHTAVLDALLTLCGAAVDVIDSNGCTALHYAVTLGHADATALLLAHGADPNRQDRKGRTPAHCGCAKGQFETVKLMAKSANLWLRNARGDLPLHEAAASGRRDLVQWLLEQRPSQVNARNNDGRCPLHLAALNDNVDMCKILLDSGAQVNPVLRTSKNVFMTPLDCALQRGFRSTAKYLQLHGGVPASRLGDPRHQLHVQVQQDVTFWGGSSSDSEEEEKWRRKELHKRKFPTRLDTKKVSSSGSEFENGGSRRARVNTSSSTIDIGKRGSSKLSSGRYDYNNEIVINGKTEINIHQSKEIVIGDINKEKLLRSLDAQNLEKLLVQDIVSVVNAKKQTVEDELIENEAKQTDRESAVSITSEETEGGKVLVVEAAIHEAPKQKVGEVEKEVREMGVQWEDNVIDPQKAEILEEKAAVEVVDEPAEEIVEEKGAVEVVDAPAEEQNPLKAIKEEETVKIDLEKTVEVDQKKDQIVEEIDQSSASKPDEEIMVLENEELVEPESKSINEEETVLVDNEPVHVVSNESDINAVDKVIVEAVPPAETFSEEEKENKVVAKVEAKKTRRKKRKPKPGRNKAYEFIYKTVPETDDAEIAEELVKNAENSLHDSSSDLDTTSSSTIKEHKSFRVLNDAEAHEISSASSTIRKKPLRKQRSRSEEHRAQARSKIPTLSKPERKTKSSLDSRVPSLPNINEKQPPRSESHMSAPAVFSDKGSGSEELESATVAAVRKKRFKKRPKRQSQSAGSDYESSNVIDSGFEPSPRSTRIPKWRHMSDKSVNMTSVTQSIQNNIRRYHLERKIFQHLLDLKRLQIRAGQHNEAVLVKRAIDAYHQSCAATVGAGRYIPEDYTFKNFEKFLYLSLRKLQIDGGHLKGLPESPGNPMLCTQSTHRCMHATHAYTGIPCAAYLPKMDHHSIPKIGFAECKPGTAGFLPNINAKKAVTLELCHGGDKQLISLPADKLDQNKRYYVTFTVKGGTEEEPQPVGHTHAKSD